MRFTTVLAGVLVVATFGCSDSSPSGPSGSSGSATLNVRLTDSPYGSAKAVLVTFSEVAAHKDGDWTKLSFQGGSTRTCDLKKLQNAAQDVLGTGGLDSGVYTMVRLQVQSAKIFFDNSAVSATPCAASIPEPAGGSAVLTIPSTEVKLNGNFSMTKGATTTMLLDFDGESSIHQNGSSYTMTPVVRVVSVQ